MQKETSVKIKTVDKNQQGLTVSMELTRGSVWICIAPDLLEQHVTIVSGQVHLKSDVGGFGLIRFPENTLVMYGTGQVQVDDGKNIYKWIPQAVGQLKFDNALNCKDTAECSTVDNTSEIAGKEV